MVKAWSRPRTNSDKVCGGESRSGMHNPLVQGSNPCGPTTFLDAAEARFPLVNRLCHRVTRVHGEYCHAQGDVSRYIEIHVAGGSVAGVDAYYGKFQPASQDSLFA